MTIAGSARGWTAACLWSADGSQLIAAGNEGDADVQFIDVEACGDRMSLRNAVSACQFDGLEGA